ncbi:MAG: hypothetical protein AB7K04_02055 [Pseudorhodoplanes sp.]
MTKLSRAPNFAARIFGMSILILMRSIPPISGLPAMAYFNAKGGNSGFENAPIGRPRTRHSAVSPAVMTARAGRIGPGPGCVVFAMRRFFR